jgi:hypothetical protein
MIQNKRPYGKRWPLPPIDRSVERICKRHRSFEGNTFLLNKEQVKRAVDILPLKGQETCVVISMRPDNELGAGAVRWIGRDIKAIPRSKRTVTGCSCHQPKTPVLRSGFFQGPIVTDAAPCTFLHEGPRAAIRCAMHEGPVRAVHVDRHKGALRRWFE